MERDDSTADEHADRKISTHTLTWSVTVALWYWNSLLPHFNSHAHVERDAHTFKIIKAIKHFNSHAHVERDPRKTVYSKYVRISTHTLTWSVTILLV